MRPKTSPIIVCTLLVVFASLTALGQGTKVPADGRPPSESERDRPQERAKWFLRGRTVNGRPAARELERAHRQKRENRRLHAAVAGKRSAGTQSVLSAETPVPGASGPAPNSIPTVGGPAWAPLGPAPTQTGAFDSTLQKFSAEQNYGPAVGRATAVVVDQSDPTGNTVYLGGASGGLWKTTNAVSAPRNCDLNTGVCTAGPNWTPLIDGEASLAVGSIALQPGNSNLVLVGTGEANNSADSYYGLGILRSTDAGATWTLITGTSDGSVSFHGLGFPHIAFSTDNVNVVVATAAAASGGLTIGAEPGGPASTGATRGIYYSVDAGLHWTRANVFDATGVSPAAGSANAVVYNSAQHKFYANIRYHGFYVSSDGITFNRLGSLLAPPGTSQPGGTLLNLTTCSSPTNTACPLYRAEMAVVPGRDEMYVWIVDSNENDKGIFQSKDGGATWNAISTTGIDTCGDGASGGCGTGTTSQATYNITLAAIPNGAAGLGGFATDLYAGGVNQYKCALNSVTNPTCTSAPFLNLTHVYGCTPTANIAHVHPDEHGIDFLGNDGTGLFFTNHPGVSPPVFFANDGGIYRVLASSSLTNGTCPSGTPNSVFDNLSLTMGSMIQFVWFSQHPGDSSTLFGGTQDNGSPGVSSAAPSNGNWLSINNGDGGFNDIDPVDPTIWYTSNPAPFTSGSGIFRCKNAVPISCTNVAFGQPVIDQTELGGDNSPFYTAFMLDPQASTRMIVGTCRVWRGFSDGTNSDGFWSVSSSGGHPLSNNFDTLSATACASTAQNMVTALAAGGPCNGACNPGANPGQATGSGSQVIWAGTDGNATGQAGGQVWVTTNADAGPTTWTRVDGAGAATCTATPAACNINPQHYPISGIAVDPHDATGKTAYVIVMGFNVGHVFKTADAGATWAKLDGDPNTTGLPDNPADAVLADPITPSLVYVATDVGVFKSIGDGSWTEVGPSSGAGTLPNVATTALKMFNSGGQLRLRVSTYGRGIWEFPLTPGYTMSVSNLVLNAYPGDVASFTGSLSTFYGYTSSVAISCGAGAPTAPNGTCSGTTVTAPATNGSFTVTASNTAVGDFAFDLVAVGSDVNHVQQQVPVTLHVSDFSLTAPPPTTVGASNTARVAFDVSAQGNFTGTVTLNCAGAPTGTSCIFSPTSVALTAGVTTTVQLDIPTQSTTPLGSYTVTITGTGPGNHAHSQNLSLTVVGGFFTMSAASALAPQGANPGDPAKPGQPLSTTMNVNSSGYAGDVSLGCAFDPAAGSPGASTCLVNPTTVTLTAGATLTSTLTVNPTGAVATNPRVIVTATDANHATSSASLGYSIVDYSLSATAPGAVVPGGSTGVSLSLVGLNGYSSTVGVQCLAPTPLTCSLNPAGPSFSVAGTAVPITATIAAPSNTTAASYTVNINSSDNNFPTLTHNQAFSVSVQDYQISANPAASVIKAGASSTHTISISGLGGFAGTVNLQVSGCPQLTTCAVSQNAVSAGASTGLTITTTGPSVAGVQPASGRHGAPLYALWMSMPGVGALVMGVGAPRRRKKLLAYICLALALALLLMLPACGGGGGGSTTSPPVPKPGTPAGTYNIVITGTSGSGASALTHSTQIALTVQ